MANEKLDVQGHLRNSTYLCQPRAEWQTIISSKTPNLSTRGCNLTDDGGHQCDDDQRNHDIGARITIGDIEEELNEGIASRTAQESLRIRNRKAKRQDRNVAKDCVEGNTPEDSAWQSLRCVFHFFCYCR